MSALMTSTTNVDEPASRPSLKHSQFLRKYNDCGVPRHAEGAWADPLRVVPASLPLGFRRAEWEGAMKQTSAAVAVESAVQLGRAGAACAFIWSNNALFRLAPRFR